MWVDPEGWARNAPTYTHARTLKLFDQFQLWKIARLTAERDKTPLPPFQPPKPLVSDGIETLLHLTNTTFVNPKFQSSLEKCFVSCCLAPETVTDTHWEFKEYKVHKHGSMASYDVFGPLGRSATTKDSELGSLGNTRGPSAENIYLCDDTPIFLH